jgi:hypothetical protein
MEHGEHGVKPLVTSDQYLENYNLDLEGIVEIRPSGRFEAKYISWAHAIRLLKMRHPDLEVGYEYNEDMEPFFRCVTSGVYILVFMRRIGLTMKTASLLYPVMDNKFVPCENPNLRDISDSMLRAAVKCIAFQTGIGLSLYSGEDIAEDSSGNTPTKSGGRKSTNHQAEISSEDAGKHWSEVTHPVGKDQGKKLSELSERTIKWWHENYEVNTAYPNSILFRKALDEWASEMEQRLEEGEIAKAEIEEITSEEVNFDD